MSGWAGGGGDRHALAHVNQHHALWVGDAYTPTSTMIPNIAPVLLNAKGNASTWKTRARDGKVVSGHDVM